MYPLQRNSAGRKKISFRLLHPFCESFPRKIYRGTEYEGAL
jgi:hypothetical protein